MFNLPSYAIKCLMDKITEKIASVPLSWILFYERRWNIAQSKEAPLFMRPCFLAFNLFNISQIPFYPVDSIPGKFPFVPTNIICKLSYQSKRIELPTHLRTAIKNIISMDYAAREKINCSDFVQTTLEFGKNQYSQSLENFSPGEDKLIAGDILQLKGYRGNDETGHVSVCIEPELELFVSIYGLGGALVFSTLDDMMESGWGCCAVRVLKSKTSK